MNEYEYSSSPSGSSAGVAALLLGMLAGAAALVLSTPPGRRLLAQFSDRAETWTAQAAAAVAESREKVVSAVEAETPPDTGDGSQRVRELL